MKKYAVLFALLAPLALLSPARSDRPQYETEETVFGATVSEKPVAPDGTPIQIDLPPELHTKNVGGSDGAGLCVFTSLMHAAFWQNVELLFNFQAWCRQFPGGGYPDKVDRYMDKIATEHHAAKPRYIQIMSRDLSLLKLAFRTGRAVSITYGYSPSGRYGGAHIAHMVSLMHLDERWACVVDNNFPRTYEWMTPDELLKCAASGQGQFWAVIFLDPGPPPPPCN